MKPPIRLLLVVTGLALGQHAAIAHSQTGAPERKTTAINEDCVTKRATACRDLQKMKCNTPGAFISADECSKTITHHRSRSELGGCADDKYPDGYGKFCFHIGYLPESCPKSEQFATITADPPGLAKFAYCALVPVAVLPHAPDSDAECQLWARYSSDYKACEVTVLTPDDLERSATSAQAVLRKILADRCDSPECIKDVANPRAPLSK